MNSDLRARRAARCAPGLLSVLLFAACTTSSSPTPSVPAPTIARATAVATFPATAEPTRGVAPTQVSPPTSVPTNPAPSPVESPAGSVSPPTGADVVETAWGAAWDRIPVGFPLPADARSAEPADPTQGPASAVYETSAAPGTVVDLVRAGVGALGFSVEGISQGEDGSVAVNLVGKPAACRAQVSVRPLGSTHFIAIYYGAACPKP